MTSIFIDTTNDIKYKSVLVITNNEKLTNSFKDVLSSLAYKVSFFEVSKFKLIADKLMLFDLVVFDNTEQNSLKNFVDGFKNKYNYVLNIPIVILENELKDISFYRKSNVYTLLKEPFEFDELLLNIELCMQYLNQNKKVEFENGFYFDIRRDELFYNRRPVKLTRTEKSLIKLLVERKNQLVTYETIEKIVWKNRNFSKYSLRNIVKHIREKTDISLIKNSSNRGYVMNTI
ncbi:MAG: response regulator transcription factor [Campylobacterota bacterium]